MKIAGRPDEITDQVWKELCARNGHLTKYMFHVEQEMGRRLEDGEHSILINAYCNGYISGSTDTWLLMQNKKVKK